jgi:hypothetical protein
VADLILLDKHGNNYIHEPNEIAGLLYVDDKYLCHMTIEGDSKVWLCNNYSELSLKGGSQWGS